MCVKDIEKLSETRTEQIVLFIMGFIVYSSMVAIGDPRNRTVVTPMVGLKGGLKEN